MPADGAVRAGRLSKARQFFNVAQDARELANEDANVADAAVTLYVHAGVAAADAICARALGVHARGQDHREAIDLLNSVDAAAAKALSALLSMKTRAGYGHNPINHEQLVKAQRAAQALLDAAA